MRNLRHGGFVGAIYDLDDTLLSNHPDDGNPYNLHERARLGAVQEFGAEIGHTALSGITAEENQEVFLNAATHTTDAAVWELLRRYGVVDSKALKPDPTNPALQAILRRRTELYMGLLETLITEVPGSSAFVRGMEDNGLKDMQAIASGAELASANLYRDRFGLTDVFPRHRLVMSGDYENPKPHPDPFNMAFRTLGLPDEYPARAHTLAVEDDPKGWLSAERAGLYVCALTTRLPPDAFIYNGQRPRHITANMTELAEQLGVPLAQS